MIAKTRCPKQCLNCKWHVSIELSKLGGLVRHVRHKCMYKWLKEWEEIIRDEIVRNNWGICPWYKKEANDD